MNKEQQKAIKDAIRKLRVKASARRHEAEQLDKQADKLEGSTDVYSPIENDDD